MIDTSIFTYFPPMSFRPNYCFLGFSRHGKEDQITQECWKNIVSTVEKKVAERIRKQFKLCTCPSDTFSFVCDRTEVGITLTKLNQNVKPLFEIGKEKVEEEGLVANLEEHVAKVVQKVIDTSSPQYKKELLQRKINEFAVKVLCEMSVEANIDKKHILNEIQKAKKEGYLPENSYYHLKSTILEC